jgi:hypothetical protein
MIPDKLLINLKIISKIQKNGRIARSYDGIISLENDVFYQSVKRFITNDSRRQAIFEINSVITECVDILTHILNSKYMNKNFHQSDEYLKNCENLNLILNELECSRTGIENLKFTYQSDPNIVSQIDIIILKINTTLRDMSQKLLYYQGFLPSHTQLKDYTNIPVTNSRDDNSSFPGSASYQNSLQDPNIPSSYTKPYYEDQPELEDVEE